MATMASTSSLDGPLGPERTGPIGVPVWPMGIPRTADCDPILFQHGLEHLQAGRLDQLLELGLGINEDLDQREVARRRGFRLATTSDCARLLLHGRCARTLPRPGHLEQAKRKSQLEWHSLCWPN